MTSENFRLDRFEELFDRLGVLTQESNPDLEEIATISLLALINDQLAFIRTQHETGHLPQEHIHTGMRLLESPYVYGYLVGGGAYVGALVGEHAGGHAATDATQEAFAELYGEHGERNWNAFCQVEDTDPDLESGLEDGAEDLRRFVSRLQGADLGPSSGIARYLFDGIQKLPRHGETRVTSQQEDEIESVFSVFSSIDEYSTMDDESLRRSLQMVTTAFGISGDDRFLAILDVIYPIFMDRQSLASRMAFYSETVDDIKKGSSGHEALRVFLIHDDNPSIVSTASLDFAVYHPLSAGDPMTGPKAVLEMFQNSNVKCRGGLFKGLLMLGDDRVLDLMRAKRGLLTFEETRAVCGMSSGFPFAAAIEFLIDWLEEAEDREDEGLYALVAGAIGIEARDAIVPMVTDGRRRFPVGPDGDVLEEGWKKIPIDEFAKTIAPRLRAIADREPPPQIMPIVLGAWGL